MKKVVVGMSGGVDSSVAAYLLKEQGYDVIGVTMEIWQPDKVEVDGSCCGLSAVEDARSVANILDIPYYVLNFRKEFKESVIDYFIDDYLNGETPNPCIACNRYVKWESLLNKSLQLGAEYIATGHYAKVEKHPTTGRYTIKTADTETKDQTYALYNLTQFQLSHTLMPVGSYEKPQIREIAEKIGLRVAHKPDSQDICFIPDGNHMKFIEEYTHEKVGRGNFLDINGKVIGQHNGYYRYTVGQRKGINVNRDGKHYVLEIRPETNEVVVGRNKDLFANQLIASDFNWISGETPTEPIRISGRTRYHQPLTEGTAEVLENGDVKVTFDEPIRAITKGQSVVLYNGDVVLGGGAIVKSMNSQV